MFITSNNTSMPGPMLEKCLAYGKLVHYPVGKLIHDRGDKKPGISLVVSGEVEVGNYDIEGRYYLTAILGVGEVFGEFTVLANLPRTHNAVAMNNCQILQISASQTHKLLTDIPQVQTFLLQSLATRLHKVLERLDDVIRLPTHVQLAKYLYQIYSQTQHNKIELRQQDLAIRLGVTVLSIHKAIKKLSALNLIHTSYGAVLIPDRVYFVQWLNEQSGILPLNNEN